jgi:ribonuclease P protein component
VTRDFDGIYRDPARRQRSRRFLVLARPGSAPRTRWGVSIKARLGHAVVRNRIRRRVREIMRRSGARLPAGWDIVIQPRTAEVAGAEFGGVQRELEELLAAALGAGAKS